MLLNGPPGVGKTTLARRYLQAHPEARCVEVDHLRMQLDGWQDDETSKVIARDLALSAVEESLSEGRDVVVPQFLGRVGFVDRLAAAAGALGARFVHVVLACDAAVAVGRFEQRRAELAAAGVRHPEHEVVDAVTAIEAAMTQLRALAVDRPGVVVLPAGGTDDLVPDLDRLVG